MLPFDALALIPFIDVHIRAGGGAIAAGGAGGEAYLITDMDITFYGGPNGNFEWLNKNGRLIWEWRPGTENAQSTHWSGLQILLPGGQWAFNDGSDLGMDVEACCWLVATTLTA